MPPQTTQAKLASIAKSLQLLDAKLEQILATLKSKQQ